MDEQKLAEIENCACYELSACCDAVPDLVAEVRRLQRENRLLNLSRGVPSLVGMD